MQRQAGLPALAPAAQPVALAEAQKAWAPVGQRVLPAPAAQRAWAREPVLPSGWKARREVSAPAPVAGYYAAASWG